MGIGEKNRSEFDDAADAKLIAGIANGDRECFHEIHERYYGILFATIFKVLNDRPDSEEVTQEVMFSLWKKAHLYHNGRGRPVTWLTSMARNRAIDRLRSKQRVARLKEGYGNEQITNPSGTVSIDGPQAAVRRDACRNVRSAVLKLTEVQRQAIEMAYFDGLTQQEIADQLGEPLGTVKARIRRGLARLKESYGE
ncbi:MAG: sigma-70 family RNA polymerase sigma factor [Verrucomicrobiota bacterium]